jgi:hypothetical protein
MVLAVFVMVANDRIPDQDPEMTCTNKFYTQIESDESQRNKFEMRSSEQNT